ncbi:hypothetical protein RR46_00872 [Papilio xuthus]|uniref:Uncharacterized protein n=1 Tax=Papilio xuthus TaxID=66420 RepID=A0A0N0P9G9_PAPXU|nr:hypothetical protein RR46_00872 [Papilio xuthus]
MSACSGGTGGGGPRARLETLSEHIYGNQYNSLRAKTPRYRRPQKLPDKLMLNANDANIALTSRRRARQLVCNARALQTRPPAAGRHLTTASALYAECPRT